MSWLFGILRKNNSPFPKFELNEEFQKVEGTNLFLVLSQSINSTFVQSSKNNIQAFVGIPIIENDGVKINLAENHLKKLKYNNQEMIYGHFVFVNNLENHISVFNDKLGLRELYYFEKDDQLFFSTRIDLLQKHINSITLNPSKLCSLWLTNFQLSQNSVFNEIKRLGPNGRIVLDGNQLSITKKEFNVPNVNSKNDDFEKLVSKYCLVETIDENETTLALSGGIDSRYVLSSLLKGKQKFSCHTIVNEEDKDLKISEKICSKFKLQHELINRGTLNLGDIEDKILQYYKFISPNIPLTQMLDFGVYGMSYLKDKLILDGGFGGFYRRQYLNKFFIKGARNFNCDNWPNIQRLLAAPKPTIFSLQFHQKLENELKSEIIDLCSEFGEVDNKEKLAEILDVISVKYMLSNIYGSGQTILDQEITSIMPLAQKDVIDAGMNLSLTEKVDSKLFKKTIKKNKHELAKINLVNNNLENPYYLNYKLAMAKLLINRKFNKTQNYDRYKILFDSKNFILDLLNQREVIENSYLNSIDNSKMVDEFFKGDLSKGIFVDWLMTFVLWSRANGIT